MVVYKHTCCISDKSYIGITQKCIDSRLKEHINSAMKYESNFAFHRAIRKYGIENFTSEIIEGNITDVETLREREIYWIEHYGTFGGGYNMTKGGDGGVWTEESHIKGVETRKMNGSYISGAKKRLETIGDDIQKIVDKTANTRKERGDFKRLSEKVKGVGIGYYHTCPYCGKEAKGANYTRWHGDNCKENPNITQDQLDKRKPWNKKENNE